MSWATLFTQVLLPLILLAWLALIVIGITHRVRGVAPGPGVWQASGANSVAIVLVCGLGLVGAYMGYQAIQGQILPKGAVADIAAPFPPGHYLVAHGGSTEMVNVHLKTLDGSVERFRPWRGQSRALDIFRMTPLGLHKK